MDNSFGKDNSREYSCFNTSGISERINNSFNSMNDRSLNEAAQESDNSSKYNHNSQNI